VFSKGKRIKYTRFQKYEWNQITELMKIRFKDYNKYFKNMEIGDAITVQLFQIYQFDDGPIISEKSPYILRCFEYDYQGGGRWP
jgi:hypothetical protein